MISDNQELDALLAEYNKYGCSTLISVAVLLVIFAAMALPGSLVAIGLAHV